MTLNKAEQLLNKFLTGVASSIGFGRTGDWYARPDRDVIGLLSFPRHLHSAGFVAFTCNVGLRFESLSKWLFDDIDSPTTPTIVTPIHFLRANSEFSEWHFTSEDDLEKLRDTILDDLRKYALPFIERYSPMAKLRKVLESPDKKDWFDAGVDVDTRVTTLAAIRFVEGDKDGAIKTLEDGLKVLDETLAGRPHELRKRRFEMYYLRKRLLANS